ncbi:MAG: hypothetical protein ABJA98_00350 [Acidobacteriota bacterium]
MLGICIAALVLIVPRLLCAQEAPPRIGPFVVDFHGIMPKFGDSADLALSRDLSPAELPGLSLGATGGFHVYLPKIAGVTVGLGGEALITRAHSDPPGSVVDPNTGLSTPSSLRPVTETFKSISPQLSLNFGNGNGWSYLSVGIGRSLWSIVPDGTQPRPPDEEPIRTINYGGGARWFIKPHLAFSLDVRLYEIDAGTPTLDLQGSPRTVLLVIGAGISIR